MYIIVSMNTTCFIKTFFIEGYLGHQLVYFLFFYLKFKGCNNIVEVSKI